jgi:hypothetical protein
MAQRVFNDGEGACIRISFRRGAFYSRKMAAARCRTTETKIVRKNTASFGLIGLVPNAMVKPFHKLSRG